MSTDVNHRASFPALLMVLAVCAPGSESRAQSVHGDVSGPEVRELLENMGFDTELTSDETGDPFVRVRGGAFNWSIVFYNCSDASPKRCTGIQPRTAFGTTRKLDNADINEWNRKHRYLRASLDGDQDPVLDMYLLFTGGISDDNVRKNLMLFTQAVESFRRWYGQRG